MRLEEAKQILNDNGFVLETYEEDLEKLGKAMTKQGIEDYIKNVARVFATTTKSFTVEEITGLMLNYMWEFLEEYQDEGCWHRYWRVGDQHCCG